MIVSENMTDAQIQRIMRNATVLAANANQSMSAPRRVTNGAVSAVVHRSLDRTSTLPFSVREHIALRDVSDFITITQKNKTNLTQRQNMDLLPVCHPASTRAHAMTASALRRERSRWIAADPRITTSEARALVASASAATPFSAEESYYISRIAALPAGSIPLEALVASMSGGNSSAARSARARMQRRDSEGRFAWMGGGMSTLVRRIGGQSVHKLTGRFIAQGVGSDDTFDVELSNGRIARVPAKASSSSKGYIEDVDAVDGFSPVPARITAKDTIVNEADIMYVDAPNGFSKDDSYTGPGTRYTDDAYEVIKVDPNGSDDEFEMIPDYLARRDASGRSLLDEDKPVFVVRRVGSDSTDNGYQTWADTQDWIRLDQKKADAENGVEPDPIATLDDKQLAEMWEEVGDEDPYEYVKRKFGLGTGGPTGTPAAKDESTPFEFDDPSGQDFIDDAITYEPEGREGQDAADYTDDPAGLAQTFDVDALTKALTEAVTSDNPAVEPTGEGTLDFLGGDEKVPAQAIYDALKESGADAQSILAKIYDGAPNSPTNNVARLDAQRTGKPVATIDKPAKPVETPVSETDGSEITEARRDAAAFARDRGYSPEAIDLIEGGGSHGEIRKALEDYVIKTKSVMHGDYNPYKNDKEDYESRGFKDIPTRRDQDRWDAFGKFLDSLTEIDKEGKVADLPEGDGESDAKDVVENKYTSLPPLFDGLSEEERNDILAGGDYTKYLPKNDTFDGDGYIIHPDPFTDSISPVWDPIAIANRFSKNQLLEGLANASSPDAEVSGTGSIGFINEDGEKDFFHAPAEAIRDAAQMHGVDTNEFLHNVYDKPVIEEDEDEDPVADLPTGPVSYAKGMIKKILQPGGPAKYVVVMPDGREYSITQTVNEDGTTSLDIENERGEKKNLATFDADEAADAEALAAELAQNIAKQDEQGRAIAQILDGEDRSVPETLTPNPDPAPEPAKPVSPSTPTPKPLVPSDENDWIPGITPTPGVTPTPAPGIPGIPPGMTPNPFTPANNPGSGFFTDRGDEFHKDYVQHLLTTPLDKLTREELLDLARLYRQSRKNKAFRKQHAAQFKAMFTSQANPRTKAGKAANSSYRGSILAGEDRGDAKILPPSRRPPRVPKGDFFNPDTNDQYDPEYVKHLFTTGPHRLTNEELVDYLNIVGQMDHKDAAPHAVNINDAAKELLDRMNGVPEPPSGFSGSRFVGDTTPSTPTPTPTPSTPIRPVPAPPASDNASRKQTFNQQARTTLRRVESVLNDILGKAIPKNFYPTLPDKDRRELFEENLQDLEDSLNAMRDALRRYIKSADGSPEAAAALQDLVDARKAVSDSVGVLELGGMEGESVYDNDYEAVDNALAHLDKWLTNASNPDWTPEGDTPPSAPTPAVEPVEPVEDVVPDVVPEPEVVPEADPEFDYFLGEDGKYYSKGGDWVYDTFGRRGSSWVLTPQGQKNIGGTDNEPKPKDIPPAAEAAPEPEVAPEPDVVPEPEVVTTPEPEVDVTPEEKPEPLVDVVPDDAPSADDMTGDDAAKWMADYLDRMADELSPEEAPDPDARVDLRAMAEADTSGVMNKETMAANMRRLAELLRNGGDPEEIARLSNILRPVLNPGVDSPTVSGNPVVDVVESDKPNVSEIAKKAFEDRGVIISTDTGSTLFAPKVKKPKKAPAGDVPSMSFPDDVVGNDSLSKGDTTELDADTYDYSDEAFPPTKEQRRIISAVAKGYKTVVRALAGTGKTTTLKLIAKRLAKTDPGKKIVYIAFNKDVQVEADETMPRNVEARTGDSIAWEGVSEEITRKSRGEGSFNQLTKFTDIAKAFKIKNFVTSEGVEISNSDVAEYIMNAITQYSISADDRIGPQHFESQPVPPEFLEYAEAMWKDINSPDGVLQPNNSHITKIWALTRPDLSKKGAGLKPNDTKGQKEEADIIFFDEAQDINPVMAKVMADQTIQIIYVGDSNQAIYGFRGAVDELQKIDAEYDLPLTQSWRFGPEVAEVGNKFLRILKTPFRVIGGGAPSEILPAGTMTDPDAILTRTNGGAMGEILSIISVNGSGTVVGTPKNFRDDFVRLLDEISWLKWPSDKKYRPKSEDFAPYSDWQEVMEAVQSGKANPRVSMMVGLYLQHGDKGLAELLGGIRFVVREKITAKVLRPAATLDDLADTKNAHILWSGWGKYNSDLKYTVTEGEDGSVLIQLFGGPTMSKSKIKFDLKRKFEYAKDLRRHPAIPVPKPTAKWPHASGYSKRFATREDALAALNDLQDSIQGIPKENIDIFVSTVHRAKGLEWDSVRIGEDFKGPEINPETGEAEFPEDESLRLDYVAVTRAKKRLDPGSLSWILSISEPPSSPESSLQSGLSVDDADNLGTLHEPKEPTRPPFKGDKLQQIIDQAGGDPAKIKEALANQPVYFYDFETTGQSWSAPKPVQVAIFKYEGGMETDRRVIYMNPDESLSDWSSRNLTDADGNPLTNEWVRQQKPTSAAMQEVYDFLGDDPIMVAFNADYDASTLEQAMAQSGIPFLVGSDIDPLSLAREAGLTPDNRLRTVAEYFGLADADTNYHDAEVDAILVPKIFSRYMDHFAKSGARFDFQGSWDQYSRDMEKYHEAKAEYDAKVRELEAEGSQIESAARVLNMYATLNPDFFTGGTPSAVKKVLDTLRDLPGVDSEQIDKIIDTINIAEDDDSHIEVIPSGTPDDPDIEFTEDELDDDADTDVDSVSTVAEKIIERIVHSYGARPLGNGLFLLWGKKVKDPDGKSRHYELIVQKNKNNTFSVMHRIHEGYLADGVKNERRIYSYTPKHSFTALSKRINTALWPLNHPDMDSEKLRKHFATRATKDRGDDAIGNEGATHVSADGSAEIKVGDYVWDHKHGRYGTITRIHEEFDSATYTYTDYADVLYVGERYPIKRPTKVFFNVDPITGQWTDHGMPIPTLGRGPREIDVIPPTKENGYGHGNHAPGTEARQIAEGKSKKGAAKAAREAISPSPIPGSNPDTVSLPDWAINGAPSDPLLQTPEGWEEVPFNEFLEGQVSGIVQRYVLFAMNNTSSAARAYRKDIKKRFPDATDREIQDLLFQETLDRVGEDEYKKALADILAGIDGGVPRKVIKNSRGSTVIINASDKAFKNENLARFAKEVEFLESLIFKPGMHYIVSEKAIQDSPKSFTLGYATSGDHSITLQPSQVGQGVPKDVAFRQKTGKWHPGHFIEESVGGHTSGVSLMAHEMGHNFDEVLNTENFWMLVDEGGTKADLDTQDTYYRHHAAGAMALRRFRDQSGTTGYAKASHVEAYAEAFAAWVLSYGNPITPGVMEVAEAFGWPEQFPNVTAARQKQGGGGLVGELRDVIKEAATASSAYYAVPEADRDPIANHGDWGMAELARRAGFDALPDIMTSDEMDELVAVERYPEMFRGLAPIPNVEPEEYKDLPAGTAARQMAENFRRYQLFAGTGVIGAGTYTTGDVSLARSYGVPGSGAFPEEWQESVVLRMLLKPSARVVEIADLWQEMREWNDSQTGYDLDSPERRFMQDPGRAAVVFGYDVIVETGGSPSGHNVYVVLNRGQVIVQDTDTIFNMRDEWTQNNA